MVVGKKLFKCDIKDCEKTCSTKFSLKRHNLTHYNEKKFVCKFCGKQFVLPQYLEEHQYTHTGQRPYICGINGCQEQFRQRGKLSIHKKHHHKDDQSAQPNLPGTFTGLPHLADQDNLNDDDDNNEEEKSNHVDTQNNLNNQQIIYNDYQIDQQRNQQLHQNLMSQTQPTRIAGQNVQILYNNQNQSIKEQIQQQTSIKQQLNPYQTIGRIQQQQQQQDLQEQTIQRNKDLIYKLYNANFYNNNPAGNIEQKNEQLRNQELQQQLQSTQNSIIKDFLKNQSQQSFFENYNKLQTQLPFLNHPSMQGGNLTMDNIQKIQQQMKKEQSDNIQNQFQNQRIDQLQQQILDQGSQSYNYDLSNKQQALNVEQIISEQQNRSLHQYLIKQQLSQNAFQKNNNQQQ